MSDEICRDQVASQESRVRSGRLVGNHQIRKRAGGHHTAGLGQLRPWRICSAGMCICRGFPLAAGCGRCKPRRRFRSEESQVGRSPQRCLREMLVEDPDHCRQMHARIDGQQGALGPVGGRRSDEQAGNVVFAGSASRTLCMQRSCQREANGGETIMNKESAFVRAAAIGAKAGVLQPQPET